MSNPEDEITEKNKQTDAEDETDLPVYDLKIDDIRPNPDNTNEMDDETFSKFIDQIQEKGFDVPVIVVEEPNEESNYMIIDGEHRWRAADRLNFDTIPAIIKDSLTEKDYLTEPTKRNELTGELNPHKTENLVSKLQQEWGIEDESILAEELGTNTDKIEEHIEEEVQTQEEIEEQVEEEVEEDQAEQEVSMVDNLSTLLNDLISKYGDTIPQSFMAFSHPNGGIHLLVGMDNEMKELMKQVAVKLDHENIDANEFFRDVLAPEVEEYSEMDDVEFETEFGVSKYDDEDEEMTDY